MSGDQAPLATLRDYLHSLADLYAANQIHARAGAALRYPSSAALVLAHGRGYQPQPLPSRYRPGQPRRCFNTAYALAQRHAGLTYIEGYGLCAGTLGLTVPHAWCITEAGEVIDPTWRWQDQDASGTAYTGSGALLGVAVPDELRQLIWSARREWGVLDDYEHGYPALRLGWDVPALIAFYREQVARHRAEDRAGYFTTGGVGGVGGSIGTG